MSNKAIHAVLGYGAVGKAVIDALEDQNISYKILNKSRVDQQNSYVVDVMDVNSLLTHTQDVTHLYITIGLPYSLDAWKAWPSIMRNIISASDVNGFKIIFFDNIYMYGPAPLQNPITETHPQAPVSRKGKVRKQTADLLLEKAAYKAVIGRSGDFYGPGAVNSLLYINMIQNQLKGKRASFVGNPSTKHSYTYLHDAGRAMVLLALDDSSYGKVWHLPTNNPEYTTTQLANMSARLLNAPTGVSAMPKILVKFLRNFVPILKEVDEMTYQTSVEYNFSSDAFIKKHPSFMITSYENGLKNMVESFTAKS